jgi:outer membrane protein OmpA-like peptidoglycan-associated protein
MRTIAWLAIALGGTFIAPPLATAESDCPGKTYGKGKRSICLPQGESSFADTVVSFTPGARPSEGVWADPAQALGEPDFTRTSQPGFLSLGCDGELVMRFDDNALVEVPGPDLYVFEVGPMVEAVDLGVSVDGQRWIAVGRIEGARAELDLEGLVEPGESYRFVRLANRSKGCGGRHSGADIDAVAAVGSALRLSLDAAVLFDSGSAALKPQADATLARAAEAIRLRRGTVRIEGHTDADGDDRANQLLSEQRAAAVRDALVARSVDAARLEVAGFGESRPVAANDSADGKARNRRVELILR